VPAIVLLPDYLYAAWELQHGDSDCATRWRQIKTLVTRALAGRIDGTAMNSAGSDDRCVQARTLPDCEDRAAL
jgi:hypothetical protein